MQGIEKIKKTKTNKKVDQTITDKSEQLLVHDETAATATIDSRGDGEIHPYPWYWINNDPGRIPSTLYASKLNRIIDANSQVNQLQQN